ncbi:MAG: hypothetical protein WC043_00475 [Pseudobdellovibrionaceae bacterium]
MLLQPNNNFSIDYLKAQLLSAIDRGYKFLTLQEFIDAGCPNEKAFVIRLDLDFKPQTLRPFVVLAKELEIKYTVFVRTSGPYNVFWYPNTQCLLDAHEVGCEMGLHSTPVEWATIMGTNIKDTLRGELEALRTFFPVTSMAPHRDINYMYNSLPWLDENWSEVSHDLKLNYHAYERRILDNVLYVNEGLSPHLCWRGMTPAEAVETGKSICLLLHPHWWYVNHPFETD